MSRGPVDEQHFGTSHHASDAGDLALGLRVAGPERLDAIVPIGQYALRAAPRIEGLTEHRRQRVHDRTAKVEARQLIQEQFQGAILVVNAIGHHGRQAMTLITDQVVTAFERQARQQDER